MHRLIINADDFGLTRGVNRGIAECCQSGIVTSATLMAGATAFEDAVSLANQLFQPRPGPEALSADAAEQALQTSIGCHVVLVDGVPLLSAAQIPSLLPDGATEFRGSFVAFARAALGGRLRPEQLAAEATAQLQKVQSAGIALSHFDTHKHVHMFPAVLKPLLRAARECGVRAVRNPFAPPKPLAYAQLFRRPHLWKRYAEVKLLRGWAAQFRRAAEAEGMATTDGTFGIVVTGALDEPLFRAIVESLPEGTWELCCHPGYHDAELSQVHTRLRDSRDREREVLTAPGTREVLNKYGVELISYWDLQ